MQAIQRFAFPEKIKTPVTVLKRVSCLQLRDSTGVAPVSLLPGDCRHSRKTDVDLFFHSSILKEGIQVATVFVKIIRDTCLQNFTWR